MTSTTQNTQADTQGHLAHSKAADTQDGLRGEITRPIVVTFLGAGSGFCPNLCRDVLMIPGADRGEFRLVDIDTDRLGTMQKVVENIIDKTGRLEGWRVSATTDRREALPGTTYAICCVEVSGVECVAWDNDIPLKYGVDQCIGDTIGPGGLFKGLRTIPVFLDILRDMVELCPQAMMLNYTNPMNMMCLAAGRAVPQVPVVGLCHSVQGTSHLLAEFANVRCEQMHWACAGINHLAWFTKLQHAGEDLYPQLMKKFEQEIYGQSDIDRAEADLIRKDICLHFGAFVTESSGHFSEYLPYYRHSDAGKAYLGKAYHGGSRFYASQWPGWRRDADAHRMKLVSGEKQVDLERSWEYASWIIEACEKDAGFQIHGNVMNTASDAPGEAGKLITNLPGDGCVEVACLVNRNGIQPTRYGALPPQMAHLCASNMAVFDLAATAAIERSKEAAIHALLLDPLTSACCTPRQIKSMALELFEAEKDFLTGYR